MILNADLHEELLNLVYSDNKGPIVSAFLQSYNLFASLGAQLLFPDSNVDKTAQSSRHRLLTSSDALMLLH